VDKSGEFGCCYEGQGAINSTNAENSLGKKFRLGRKSDKVTGIQWVGVVQIFEQDIALLAICLHWKDNFFTGKPATIGEATIRLMPYRIPFFFAPCHKLPKSA